ncbi:hypothetical protein E2C01_002305 [Portunus trituberculatus]|uniref:Uncharacterized protein n=1 Tax=Portunus trituberculatus TaxID=210409 RepID=A0A5B7CKN3_PORTR|nr:hypothetical protein [Portunus trituberculatus]
MTYCGVMLVVESNDPKVAESSTALILGSHYSSGLTILHHCCRCSHRHAALHTCATQITCTKIKKYTDNKNM